MKKQQGGLRSGPAELEFSINVQREKPIREIKCSRACRPSSTRWGTWSNAPDSGSMHPSDHSEALLLSNGSC
eukprot:1332644-Amphidinium_carterae.1